MREAIERLGRGSIELVETLGRVALFGLAGLGAMLRPPARARRFVNELYDVGVLSLAIVCLSGVTVGAVLGLQGYNTLVRFGAEDSLGAVIGLTLIRELGPVFTALLVTGRAGSAMAAEIASMVQSQQLDGLRMMSIDPLEFVVAPKALAMLVVMPMVTALFIVFALLGGYIVGVGLMGLDGGIYLTSLETSVEFNEDVLQSLVKAFLFGGLVALIATFRGYTARPTSAGVSAATTGTVVAASVAILLADFVVTAFWTILFGGASA